MPSSPRECQVVTVALLMKTYCSLMVSRQEQHGVLLSKEQRAQFSAALVEIPKYLSGIETLSPSDVGQNPFSSIFSADPPFILLRFPVPNQRLQQQC